MRRITALATWPLLLIGATIALTSQFAFASGQQQIAQIELEDASREQSNAVELYYFEDPLCSVCAQQERYMEELKEQYEELIINTHPISDTETFKKLADERGITDYRIMAPSTFVNDELLQFSSFGEREKQALRSAIEGKELNNDSVLRLPLIGTEIDMNRWSLPVLAIALGSLDGFNVCSLGALILILSIVLTFNSRKKIIILGGLFILTTVLVYGGLVFIWGRLIDVFIGQLSILRLLVGLAAVGGSVWFFKEFWRFYRYGPSCESSNSKLALLSSKRLIQAFNAPNKGPLALGGAIILFAIAITIVELPCSIGVPIAFTGILIESGLSLGMYSLYVGIYLFFYMLIELIIFTGAVLTKEIWFTGSNVITWTTFTGAVVLLALGLYYLLSLVS